MTILQITVPDDMAHEWRQAAKAMGLGKAVGAWIRLQVAAAKQQEQPVPGSQPLGERVLKAVGTGLAKRDVPKLAQQLDVPARSVHAALGSLVARKRLVRTGDEYRLTGG